MNSSNNTFLGTGWFFPPTFDNTTGSVELAKDIEDINQSLNILLSTSLGERVMQPRYGCNLHDFLFEPLSSSVIGYIQDLVENAILIYEPRIIAEKVEVTSADSFDIIQGRFTIEVEYSIPGTNSRFNYVYDYYKNEALRSI
jgi:phage baseplate assembly protein W